MANFIVSTKFIGLDNSGVPVNGGLLYTYDAGTTTNKATYPTLADAAAGTNANANPVVLDSRGEANVVLTGNYQLKFNSADDATTFWTVDNFNIPQNIDDANGNELLEFTTTASAVNNFGMTNAATGNAPIFSAEGEANIGMTVNDSNGNELFVLTSVASAVNYVELVNSATGNGPILRATGGDTNVNLRLEMKGSGDVILEEGAERAFLLEENSTGAGDQMTLAAGAALTTGTDLTGGALVLAAGTSQGAGASAVYVQTAKAAASSATTNAVANRVIIDGTYMELLPHGTSAGNTLELRFNELVANGTNYGLIKGADSYTANRTFAYPDSDITRVLVDRTVSTDGAVATGTTILPHDDTVPAITEGDEYITVTHTPSNASNQLEIVANLNVSHSSAGAKTITSALFQDATSPSLNAVATFDATSGQEHTVSLVHYMTAGTTSATTFRIRIGSDQAGTTTFNGGSGSRNYGGVNISSLTVNEYTP